jgi:hypothetical protein
MKPGAMGSASQSPDGGKRGSRYRPIVAAPHLTSTVILKEARYGCS